MAKEGSGNGCGSVAAVKVRSVVSGVAAGEAETGAAVEGALAVVVAGVGKLVAWIVCADLAVACTVLAGEPEDVYTGTEEAWAQAGASVPCSVGLAGCKRAVGACRRSLVAAGQLGSDVAGEPDSSSGDVSGSASRVATDYRVAVRGDAREREYRCAWAGRQKEWRVGYAGRKGCSGDGVP